MLAQLSHGPLLYAEIYGEKKNAEFSNVDHHVILYSGSSPSIQW